MNNNILSSLKDNLNNTPFNNDDIFLVFQYFIPNNEARYNEIKFCLKKNVNLGLFKKIVLLNERIYTSSELGLTDQEMEHIEQINIKHRLKYSSTLLQMHIRKFNGYIVLCNSDIFFDNSIENVRKTSLSQEKSIYALLRFEYINYNNFDKSKKRAKLFNHPRTNKPRSDSQDVWIYHTKHMTINNELIRQTDFMLGMPGCDNKITYVFHENGFKCYNEPYIVKTYHYHETQLRSYTRKDVIPPPYLFVEPNI